MLGSLSGTARLSKPAEAAKVTKDVMRAKVKEAEEKGLETLKAAGMQIVTDVDKAKFQEALKPAYAEYGKRFGEGTIERIRAVQTTSGS